MAIENYMCRECRHGGLCKIEEKIVPFDENAKKDLGVTIIMHDCENFEQVEE